jgi:ADP-ribose pyrophosphatase YjhB (NUDIX family)
MNPSCHRTVCHKVCAVWEKSVGSREWEMGVETEQNNSFRGGQTMSSLYYRLLKWYWQLRKPVTLGARAIVTDEQNRVLLVRHTYLNGWYLPGGGVEKGESFFQAIRRELREECAIEPVQMRLCHLYFSEREGKRDHIALFHVSPFRQLEGQRPDREVAELRFFGCDELPTDTSPATRRRLDEFIGRQFREERW